MKNILLVVSIIALEGCGSMLPKVPVLGGGDLNMSAPSSSAKLEKEKTTVDIDPELLKSCKPLPDIRANPTPSEVIDQKKAEVAIFSDCASRVDKLVKLVKDAFEIK